MKKKKFILLLSVFFITLLLFLITVEAREKEFELGKNMWKDTWEKLKLGYDNKEKIADCIIIGTVTEVKDTPDDDFYFHQSIISVERCLKGDTTQKEVIIKYVFPSRMTVDRFMRGRNWVNYVKKVYKKEPQQFLYECEKKNIEIVGHAELSHYFKFEKGERVLVYLTSLPLEIHNYYDVPYCDEMDLYGLLGDFWTYDESNFREIQECKGYYELFWLQKYTIKSDNTVWNNDDKKLDMNFDKFINKIEKKIREGVE